MKQDNLAISVILPVRNGDADLLKRAVQSVESQTYPNFEILLIDDGSKEEYAKVLDRMAQEWPKVRVFHIEPSGVSVARNFAVQQAAGDVITYLDCDDVLPPCCFEEAVSLLSDPDIDALWGGTCFLSEEALQSVLREQSEPSVHSREELLSRCIPLTPERIHQTRAECIGEPLRFENGGYINRGIAARFIRKEAFADGKNQFPPGLKLCEDTIWDLRMMTQLRILYVKEIWYYYFDNSASASNHYHEDILQGMEKALGIIRGLLDLSDETEYIAYTRFLIDCLRYVYLCFYGHEEWKPSPAERKKVKQHLYTSDPWREISSKRYSAAASERDRKKAFLYRLHLLFFFWKRVSD